MSSSSPRPTPRAVWIARRRRSKHEIAEARLAQCVDRQLMRLQTKCLLGKGPMGLYQSSGITT